jgi:hypothetical protein
MTFEEWTQSGVEISLFNAFHAHDDTLADLQARIERVKALAEKITNGPFSHNCDFCHKTDYFQAGRPGINVKDHKENCPVRIADELLSALDGETK